MICRDQLTSPIQLRTGIKIGCPWSAVNFILALNHWLKWSGLEVKNSKCAAFYERRSGGNRWYQAKGDRPPSFTIMGNEIKVYTRHETYCYLGHRFNIAGEWEEQIQ